MYRYIAAGLLVLGLSLAAGMGSHETLGMVVAQGGLAMATMVSGYLFALIGCEEEEEGDDD